MDPMLIALLAFFAATILATVITPMIRDWAIRAEFVDRPDKTRKKQEAPVALGGGFAIFGSAIVVFFALWHFDLIRNLDWVALFGLLAASIVIMLTGFIDDRYGIDGKIKLLMQVFAASIVMGTDNLIKEIDVAGVNLNVGVLSYVVTLIWMLAAINSLNLLDGIDGLAANIGLVFATSFGVIALLGKFPVYGILAFCFAGGILGFLRYNSAPASIYLGDTGSMLLGLVLGSIAMHCRYKEAAGLAYLAPLTIWAIPFFDSLSAIVRRKLTGRSIYATDRGHIHHVLLTKGLTTRTTVAIITGLCFLISVATVAGIYFQSQWVGPITAACVIALLVATRLFGHVELVLLNRRLAGLGRYITQFGSREELVEHTSLNLQGDQDWDRVWEGMVETAESYGIVAMRLNLFLPKQHENFYASWKKKSSPRPGDHLWNMELPFVSNGVVVGRLKVSGDLTSSSCLQEMLSFLDYLKQIEGEVQERMNQDVPPTPDRMEREVESQQVQTGA